MRPLILLDNGYFNFYRYFAFSSWFKRAYPTDELDIQELQKLRPSPKYGPFQKIYFETIAAILKQHDATMADLIIARDGKQVWRYELFPEYKATRDSGGGNDVGSLFKWVNKHFHARLCEQGAHVLHHPALEADDIIAILARAHADKREVIVYSGDNDMLQLSDCAQIYVCKKDGKLFKNVTASDSRAALLGKIICGDPSDNIPSAFPKVGKIRAKRLIEDQALLEEFIGRYPDQYALNQTLINFDNIPEQYVAEILDSAKFLDEH